MPRNPKWEWDELILALDLYSHLQPQHTSKNNPEIVALSDLLNSLPIHPMSLREDKFRNSSGVYMKLCNFLRFDPDYTGVGLQAGSKDEELIWNEYWHNKELLARTAQAIRDNVQSVNREDVLGICAAEEFQEGRLLTAVHNKRERSGRAPKEKKKRVIAATGCLACEACGFDFCEKYGDLGKGFAECHHDKPVSELEPNEPTRLTDLSIVCANCHRIIHRKRPWLSVEQLRNQLLL